MLSTVDYVRVMGNGSDNMGRIKAINPEIVLLKPHIKQQPHGDYESVDKPKQVPIPGHTIEEITQEHYHSFEKTHVVNNYLDQPVNVQGQGLTTTGILKSFYMNQMTFKPYLGVSADGSRELVDKQFKREYKEGMTIEPVPEDILRSD